MKVEKNGRVAWSSTKQEKETWQSTGSLCVYLVEKTAGMQRPKRNMGNELAPTWTCILLSVLAISSEARDSRARQSSTSAERGVCEVTDLEFDVGSHRLKVHGSAESTEPCKRTGPSWGLAEDDRKVDLDSLLCDQVFEEGHFFKFGERQRPGAFLRDVAIPLFSALREETLPSNRDDQGVLLPAIEHTDSGVSLPRDHLLRAVSPFNISVGTIAESFLLPYPD